MDNVLRHMVRLYNMALTLKYTPFTWRKSNVTILSKSSKSDYQNPKSFRPITLSNHLLKLLEKLALWDITETVLKANPLSNK